MIYLSAQYDAVYVSSDNKVSLNVWKYPDQMLLLIIFFPLFSVSQSGLAGDVCPDPGVPENGKRMGSAFQ